MDPMEVLKNIYEQLTNKEKQIADLILENPKIIMQTTSDSLSEAARSSKTALIRMCQKMGYSGYTDLKYGIIHYLSSNQEEQVGRSLIQSITDKYCKQLALLSEYVTPSELENLSKKLMNARRLKTYGNNRTGLAANQFKMRLSKIGVDCEYLQDQILLYDALNYGTPEDVIVLFSIRGNSPNYPVVFADQKKEHGVTIVLITMTPKCPLSKYAEMILSLPNISRSDSQAYLDDQAIFFVFIEIVINAISNMMRGDA